MGILDHTFKESPQSGVPNSCGALNIPRLFPKVNTNLLFVQLFLEISTSRKHKKNEYFFDISPIDFRASFI